MARSPYSLFSRKPTGIFYVQLWNPESSRYGTARSTGTTNRPKARAIAKQWCREREEEKNHPKDPEMVAYLRSFWDWDKSSYIESKLLRRPGSISRTYTRTNAAYIEAHAVCWFKKQKRSEVTATQLAAFQLHLRKSTALSGRSVNAIFESVAIPLREAYRMGELDRDPTRPIRKLWAPGKEKGIPTNAEISALMQHTWPDARVASAFKVATICGLRLGEILALRREDVTSDTLLIRHSYSRLDGLKSPKNGRSRTVPLPDFLREELLELLSHNPHKLGWVFWGNSPEKPVDGKVITQKFYTALKAIGISPELRKARNITFHSLRHFCNATLRGSIADDKLRLLTGHLSKEMTDHYDHITEQDLMQLKSAQDSRILALIKTPA